jgi:hypothetical protein
MTHIVIATNRFLPYDYWNLDFLFRQTSTDWRITLVDSCLTSTQRDDFAKRAYLWRDRIDVVASERDASYMTQWQLGLNHAVERTGDGTDYVAFMKLGDRWNGDESLMYLQKTVLIHSPSIVLLDYVLDGTYVDATRARYPLNMVYSTQPLRAALYRVDLFQTLGVDLQSLDERIAPWVVFLNCARQEFEIKRVDETSISLVRETASSYFDLEKLGSSFKKAFGLFKTLELGFDEFRRGVQALSDGAETVAEKAFYVKTLEALLKAQPSLWYSVSCEYQARTGKVATLTLDIVHHCNFTYNSCAHYAPLVDEKKHPPMSEAEFTDALTAIKRAFGDRVKLYLCGGEPFLHPLLGRFLDIAREQFPTSFIEVITNGSWFYVSRSPSHPLMQSFSRNGISLGVTKYVRNGQVFKNVQRQRVKKSTYEMRSLMFGNTHYAHFLSESKTAVYPLISRGGGVYKPLPYGVRKPLHGEAGLGELCSSSLLHILPREMGRGSNLDTECA